MSVFESIGDAGNKAINQSELYLSKSYDYYKLKIFKQLTVSIGMVIKALAIGGVILIGVFFLSITLAIYLSSVLDNYVLGFGLVSLAYILVAILFFIFRNTIDSKIIKKLSKAFF